MASSLKTLYPVLAPILGMTSDALYARQRAYVRAGLLPSKPGRGPGSGVAATPQSIAILLIGMMTNASVSENLLAPKAVLIASTRPAPPCELTGQLLFVDALTAILSDEALAARVVEVRVVMNPPSASIEYDRSNKPADLFSTKQSNSTLFFAGIGSKPGLRHSASIEPETLRSLAQVVATLLK